MYKSPKKPSIPPRSIFKQGSLDTLIIKRDEDTEDSDKSPRSPRSSHSASYVPSKGSKEESSDESPRSPRESLASKAAKFFSRRPSGKHVAEEKHIGFADIPSDDSVSPRSPRDSPKEHDSGLPTNDRSFICLLLTFVPRRRDRYQDHKANETPAKKLRRFQY